MKKQSLHLLAGFSLLAMLAGPAWAQNGTWTQTAGGTYNWSDTNNWSGGTVAGGTAGNTAALTANLTDAQTINLGSAITLGGITIGDPTSNFCGYTVNPNGGSFVLSKSGGVTITKTGASGTATDTIHADIELFDNLTIANSGPSGSWLHLGGVIKGAKTVTVVNGASTRNLLFTGSSTYSGKTVVTRADVFFNSLANADGTTPSAFGAPGATDGTIAWGSNSSCLLKYIGSGHSSDRVLDLAGTTGSLILEASGSGPLTLTSDLTATGTGAKTLTLTGSGEGALGGIPDAAGPTVVTLSKTGAGTWNLMGNGTFTGTITVNGAGGTLGIGHNNALSSGALTLTAGRLAAVGGARAVTNSITSIFSGFGFSGTEDLSLTATIPVAGSKTFYNNLATGKTLTLAAMDLADGSARTTIFAGTGDTLVTNVIANGGGGAGSLTMSGTGTLTLKGASSYTGATALNAGGTLVLDYTSQDNSKLGDSAALTLGGANMGGTLILTNSAGNHIEQVGSTALDAGGIRVMRPSGGATLRLQALARAYGGTIDFGAEYIADISNNNINSILGGWATVGGTDWAVGGLGNTAVTAFSSYTTPFPAAGGGAAANNYFHDVAGQAQDAVAANTLKIANGQNSDSLTLNGNLTITSAGQTSLGGILYVGGYDNAYTIGGTGRILTSTAARELVFNVYTGTLMVTAPIHATPAGAGRLTKTGSGRMVINNANLFTGATLVNQGALNLQNSSALGTSTSVSVQRGAAVELEGGVNLARGLTIHGAGPDNTSGALKNASGANTWSGAITIGTGGALIGNADTGNALTLSGGITTAAYKDVTLGGAGDIVVSTVKITGAGGGVIKDGAGTAELSVANDYTGTTTVNGGTLKVTGSLASGSAVTVNTNGTLTGIGTCSGTVRVNNGGTIKAPGTVGQKLTVGSLILDNLGIASFTVAAGDNEDTIDVTTTGSLFDTAGLTIHPGAKVRLSAPNVSGTYNLIQYAGTLKGSVSNLSVDNPAPGGTYVFSAAGGYVVLQATVTESGTVVMFR